MRLWRNTVALSWLLLAGVAPGQAWLTGGHRLVTAAALDSLDEIALLLDSSERVAIVDASIQPDLMRPREIPSLQRVEAPKHFINLELLRGEPLPDDLFEYFLLLAEVSESQYSNKRARKDFLAAGMVPYAVFENTYRLAAVFAQLRRSPDDEGLQSIASYLAGLVAHYAQDLCQPLHTTVHHNGRARADGSSPQSGIHRAVDGLFQKIELPREAAVRRQPRRLDPAFSEIVKALEESHALVDTVYGLTGDIEEAYNSGEISPKLESFTRERYLQSVALTVDLIFTAWESSASIAVPSWAEPEAKVAPVQ